MRNPNEIRTIITEKTDATVVQFVYNSANLANYDFPFIKVTYENDGYKVSINEKTVTAERAK